MRAWVPLWLFPVGVLGGVALTSLGNVPGYLLAATWGLILFPYAAARVGRRWRDSGEDRAFHDDDISYWRFTDVH